MLPAPWCDVLEPICPTDVDPAFAGPQVRAVAASDITQDGGPVLKVLAGELKSGSGHDFVQRFLSDLSALAAPGRTVASEPRQVGGRQVTYVNVPVVIQRRGNPHWGCKRWRRRVRP